MRVRAATALVATGAVLLLSGCMNEQAAQPSDTPSAPVLVPGEPGAEPTVLSPERASAHGRTDSTQPRPNQADVDYMNMMIPHHQQAITMTDLIDERAEDERVRTIGGRIAAAQDAEIALMAAWLIRYGKPVPPEAGRHGDRGLRTGHTAHSAPGGHEHGPLMPGMATPEQMDALRAANGAEFDRLFLDLMITHHEGALVMAQDELADGLELRALEMAQEVIAGQAAEIEHMRNIRAD
ncbi:DUF305 domain-containing protein [Amycolatopsis aidingensis]|uniref:DUF305 domain-containing protein n=1 Tax=Amycolatopsis aidingensis TaxID=2842453 RepID=UPI001C0C6F61|nr:DUF305 domain-containing protein [Amycolatopsis aidingensis]